MYVYWLSLCPGVLTRTRVWFSEVAAVRAELADAAQRHEVQCRKVHCAGCAGVPCCPCTVLLLQLEAETTTVRDRLMDARARLVKVAVWHARLFKRLIDCVGDELRGSTPVCRFRNAQMAPRRIRTRCALRLPLPMLLRPRPRRT